MAARLRFCAILMAMDTAVLTAPPLRPSRLSPMWVVYIGAWLAYAIVIALASQTELLLGGGFDAWLIVRSLVALAPPAILLSLAWPLTGWLERRQLPLLQCCAIHMAVALSIASASHLMLALNLPEPRPFAWHVWPFMYNVMSYALVAGIFHTLRVNAAAQRQALAAQQTRTLLIAAELGALRSKLNPHFLFNTLHSIIALTQRNPAAAETALFQFSDMLRYVLDTERTGNDRVTLDAELDFVRDYLELESLRLGERLQMAWDLDPTAGEHLLPALTLQPLVENSIKHAFNPRSHPGLLHIRSRRGADGMLQLTVSDDGPGATPEAIAASSGLGLRTITRRLELAYPGRASLTIDAPPGAGFTVTVTLP